MLVTTKHAFVERYTDSKDFVEIKLFIVTCVSCCS